MFNLNLQLACNITLLKPFSCSKLYLKKKSVLLAIFIFSRLYFDNFFYMCNMSELTIIW